MLIVLISWELPQILRLPAPFKIQMAKLGTENVVLILYPSLYSVLISFYMVEGSHKASIGNIITRTNPSP